MITYDHQSDYELKRLLGQYEMLTFQSQIELKRELGRRVNDLDTSPLENAIAIKTEDIKNLDYLKDLGFMYHENANGFSIKRTRKAVWYDVASIIVGIVLIYVGLKGVLSLSGLFFGDAPFSLFPFLGGLAMTVLGLTGLKMLSGMMRLFDYLGFELSKDASAIHFCKRIDFKTECTTEETSSVELVEIENTLVLTISDTEVMAADRSNLVQRMTIVELFEKLKH